jgi:acyl-CoA synthetase (AMP-forming)/AMP-acid ligase II
MTDIDTTRALTLGDVLREHRRTYRDATAEVCGDERITYAQMDERTNRLANALQDAGVAEGDRVVWLGQNCHRVLETLLACAKLDAMLCPANWRMTADEWSFVVNDLDPKVVLWQEADLGDKVREVRASGAGEKALWVQHDAHGAGSYDALVAAGSADDPAVAVDPAHATLIMYTAAFGGRPNGSMLTHNGLLTQSATLQRLGEIWSDYAYLNCGPMFHVATFMFTVAAFHAGGKNVFTARADPEEICRLIESERCTGGFVLPPTITQILEINADGRYDLSSLRTAIPIPGWTEMTSPDTTPMARNPSAYGQTECSGIACFGAYGWKQGVVTSGRPGPATRIRIVDPDDNEVPDGETGEITVAGPIVHAGYWNRPELNAERFRGGWWHTNDLGRREPDGVIVFIGPKAHMIKTGVENVYPVEVETALERHAAVKEAAVIGVPHPKWTQTVKAIVVLNDGASATENALIEHCKSLIASYKKPTSIEFLDEPLPRTPAGMKDHAALDARFGGGNYPGTTAQTMGAASG